MTSNVPQLLADELTRRNLLDAGTLAELAARLSEGEKDFGELLIGRGIIGDADLLALKAELYKIPVIRASEVEIDQDLSARVADSTVELYKILPFAKSGETLKVALVDPENIDALQALKFIASEEHLAPEKYLVSYADFRTLSGRFLSLTSEVGKALESLTEEASGRELNISEQEADLSELTAEAPVTKVVAAVIKHAVDTKASDIHIEPFTDVIRLRFRIDGELQTALTLPPNLLAALVTRIKILSELKIDEQRLAQDGRFSTKFADRSVDFRVSTFPTRYGEKVVLRILDPLVGNIELTDLGLEGRALAKLQEHIERPYGAILLTGPTGSGKSTTLAAILRAMNREDVNIVTLEDPIEHFIHGVNQSQIHEEIGYTFAAGLRHILRQDPDIIMVGEIRDTDTAALATQAALTGHVVLSTLHTNDTIGVIPRLIDMGVQKYLIAPSLNLAAAQRLMRRLCTSCRQEVPATPSETTLISSAIKEIPDTIAKDLPKAPYKIFKAGPGCKECDNRAYRGRVAVFETLEMTDELERIILTDVSEEKLRAEADRQGMLTLYQDGILKVLRGMTSMEELLQVAQADDNG